MQDKASFTGRTQAASRKAEGWLRRALALLGGAFFTFLQGQVASDPGGMRLRFAARLTAAVALTTLLLMGLYRVLPLPVSVMAPGLIVALFASIVVRDVTLAGQRTTILLMPLACIANYGLAALLASWPGFAQGTFLLIVFAAVYARRFGPRPTALGTIAYIAFLLGTYLHPAPGELAWIALPLALGTASVLLCRFVLLRDEPDAAVRRIVRALDLRIADMLSDLAGAVQAGTLEERRPRLRLHVERLNEAVLLADEKLDTIVDADEALRPAVDDFRQQLLIAELAAERLPIAVAALDLEAGGRDQLAGGLLALEAQFRTGDPAVTRAALAESGAIAPPGLDRQLDELKAARTRISLYLDKNQNIRQRRVAETFRWLPAPVPGATQGWFGASFQQAVQVTAGCALAIAGGEMLSPNRWYWAVITAYTAFMGITSRGDSLVKIGGRLTGTVLGLFAGLALGAIAGGSHPFTIALIFVALFLGFYFFYASYALAVFWLTAYVTLLYGLTGVFSEELLVLRFEETLVGSVAAAFAAFVIFPRRTRQAFRSNVCGFLEAVGRVLDGAVGVMTGEAAPADVRDGIRQLDRKFQTIREVARPMTAWRRLTSIEETVRLLRGLNYWVRELIAVAPHAKTDPARLAAANAELHALIADLLARLRGGATEPAAEVPVSPFTPGDPSAPLPPADKALAGINRLLLALRDNLASQPDAAPTRRRPA